jgi:hypothetical protein
MARALLALLLFIAVLIPMGDRSRAEIPDLAWEAPERIDEDVAYPSSSSGVSVVSWQGKWWVVYEKYGDIYVRARGAGGWSAPVRLTDDPGLQTDPHLDAMLSYLIVVWEDHRGAQPEIWTRQFNGSSWNLEQCISCDNVASLRPVVAAGTDQAYAAWEDSSAAAVRIWGRSFRAGTWHAADAISPAGSVAREPSVSLQSILASVMVSWADYRHGDPEIYLRIGHPGYEWQPEQRLTDLPIACRRPSLRSEDCCSDALWDAPFLAFEGTAAGGVPETWMIDCYTDRIERLSADDGIPSIRPNAAAFAFLSSYCGWGGMHPHDFVVWSDEVAPGAAQHRTTLLPYCGAPAGEDLLPRDGLTHAVMGAVEGSPTARLMQVWVEDAGGMAALMSRRGGLLGCSSAQVTGPPSLMVSPQGFPANLLHFEDVCSGLPLANRLLILEFGPALDAAIRWDPLQEHPWLERITDAQGEAAFAIRGGGCSQAGPATAMCEYGFYPEISWDGVKSPDVDGDCAVRDNDVDYVQSRLGTSDFCADLDGSGLVGPEDVAIVRSALGHACSDEMGVESGPTRGRAPSLGVAPNPCIRDAVARLTLDKEAWGSIEVFDAGGRLVRVLASGFFPAGATEARWDLRDNGGRAAAAGVYYVRARLDRAVLRRPLLIAR